MQEVLLWRLAWEGSLSSQDGNGRTGKGRGGEAWMALATSLLLPWGPARPAWALFTHPLNAGPQTETVLSHSPAGSKKGP